MMTEEIKKILCKLQERAAKDIDKLLEKPDINPTEWKSAGEAVDIIKDVEESIKSALTSIAMEEEFGEEIGQSERGYMDYPMRYIRPDGGNSLMGSSYAGARRRNAMGQYMSDGRSSMNGNSYGGSSYHGEMDGAVANLRNLMNNAKTEQERMMYQRFIEEAERDRYGR
jgi:hypothetical protein